MNEISTEVAEWDGEKQLQVIPQGPRAVSTWEAFDALGFAAKLNHARAIAKQLESIVIECALAVRIGSGNHVLFEGWTTLGAMVGLYPNTRHLHELRRDDVVGYRARVEAVDSRTGLAVATAVSECWSDEVLKNRKTGGIYKRWLDEEGKPNLHAISSMAQTRAGSKALSFALRWMVKLAGYSGTPAEEAELVPEEESTREQENALRETLRPTGEAKPPHPAEAASGPPTGGPTIGSGSQRKQLYAASFKRADAVLCAKTDAGYDDVKFRPLNDVLRDYGIEKPDEVPLAVFPQILAAIESYEPGS